MVERLEKRLADRVRRLRKAEPELVASWARTHQSIYRRIRARYRRAARTRGEDRGLEIHVAGEAIALWAEVLEGRRSHVPENSYVMRLHQLDVMRGFGF